MKGFGLGISIAPKAERPFPAKKILWGSQGGGENRFPTPDEAWGRKYSGNPAPLKEFGDAVADAQERVWIVDEYLLMPDNGKPAERIDQILKWLPFGLAASDIRLLTKRHQEVDGAELKKFQKRAQEISNHPARREKVCRIEIRTHLTHGNCNFIHDRFAIIDDELWHFGGTAGGFQATVSAASRGWRAADHGAISFFGEIWNAGERK
jgi:phosphatidylserine/phosphatidylglycerophosphate/cardiolipin synthase-like enzyme